MKHYITPFYSTIVAVLLLCSSCNKQLDLRPENILVEEQLLEGKETTDRLLAGGFETQFEAERSVFPVADQSTGNAFLDVNNYYLGNIDANNTVVFGIWSAHYKAINIANVIINNLEKNAKFEVSLQKQFIAEAKFLRAFSYMRLAVIYGDQALKSEGGAKRCVPLRLNSFERADAAQIIPRSSNKQVFDQVIQDLEEAIPDLPVGYPEAQASFIDVKMRSRAVKSVGRAFLSRVSLYLGNYTEVVSNADLVLADPNYALAANPAAVFPNNSNLKTVGGNIPFNKEVIYGYPLSWSTYALDHRFGFRADPAFIQTYAPNDIRRTTMVVPLVSPAGAVTTSKYTSPNYYDNVMVIRLAEVMLNKAEALARRDGNNQTSIDLLNTIYQRAFTAGQKPALYTLASFPTKEELISRILQERRWELAFEGQDRFDRQRAGLAISPVLPENRIAFPIPQTEINITSGVLTQNPGY
jgi:hypothetical protein